MTDFSMTIKRFGFSLVLIFCTFGSYGCTPRGETKTLDEVYRASQERFSEVYREFSPKVPPAIQGELKNVVDKLQALSEMRSSFGGKSTSELAIDLSSSLLDFIQHAGYTSRPSMSEIAGQYRALGERAKSGKLEQAQLKLLISRTFSLLSSELETTRFSI